MRTGWSAELRRPSVKLAALALAVVALYAAAGFLLAPRLVVSKLEAIVERDTGLTLAVDAAAVNPFTLTVSLDNVTLFRGENTPAARLDRIEGRLMPMSFNDRAWRLRDTIVRRPRVLPEAMQDDAAPAPRQTAPGPRPKLVLAVENATLLQPQVDRGHGFVWRAERLTGSGRIEYTAGVTRVDADVAIAAFEVFDSRGEEPLATVSSITGRGITLASAPATLRIEAVQLEEPWLGLQRGRTGEFRLPPGLASVLTRPALRPGDRLAIRRGRVDFTDLGREEPVRLRVDGVEGRVSGRSASGEPALTAELRGRMQDGAEAELGAEWLPARPRTATRVALNLHRVELSALAPYVSATIGRRPAGGRLAAVLRMRIDEGVPHLESRLTIEQLALENETGDAARELPLDEAIALLEDGERRIVLSLDVPPTADGPAASVIEVFDTALAESLTALAAAPFDHLATLAGRPVLDLGHFVFAPGSAEVAPYARPRLAALREALVLRPGVGLVVRPGLHPVADRDALARQQIRLHVNLATSAGPPAEVAGRPIDFTDPKVHSVLDEFALNRLPGRKQDEIARRLPDKDARHYRAVFDALVANEEVSRAALERLARYRARALVQELSGLGVASERMRVDEQVGRAHPFAPLVTLGIFAVAGAPEQVGKMEPGFEAQDPGALTRPRRRPGP